MDIKFLCLVSSGLGILCFLFGLLALHTTLLLVSVPFLIAGLVMYLKIRKDSAAN